MTDLATTTWSQHPWVTEGVGRIRFGVQTSLASDWLVTREFAEVVEDLGFDSLWIADHPMMGCDAWTTLAAIAAVTQRIRLGTLVACASYKNPAVLARQVADVDRISGGRAVLGLGSGDVPREFDQLGYEWGTHARRHEALVDTLEITTRLLRGETVDYDGTRYAVRGATLSTGAIQMPRIPVLIAGGGEKTTLRQVVQYADACNIGAASWAGGAYTSADVQRKFEVMRHYCVEIGRPYESLLRTASVALYLAENAAEVERKRRDAESSPGGRWLVDFLEQVVLFCTPEQAVKHFQSLIQAGFDYIAVIASPLDVRTVRLLAKEVIPRVLKPTGRNVTRRMTNDERTSP
jgi:alkanesulfonate monooxygenase SsuD/methylene tetrahydromethanopterin reductase-like flavin-dependent oxidoreductase (luciferase family)